MVSMFSQATFLALSRLTGLFSLDITDSTIVKS